MKPDFRPFRKTERITARVAVGSLGPAPHRLVGVFSTESSVGHPPGRDSQESYVTIRYVITVWSGKKGDNGAILTSRGGGDGNALNQLDLIRLIVDREC